LGTAVRRWQRDSMRERGLWGSLRYLGGQLAECVRDSMPERRRSRFGDVGFDCDHRVDTTWARLPLSVRLREIFTERLYQPTTEEEFSQIMRHLEEVDLSRYTFIDMGSGKGRVLLMASMYPFARILGVEVQPALHEIATRNLRCFRPPGQRCGQIETVCADAREFEFPGTDLVVYLFNPFPDYVLRDVLANLTRSARSLPRSILVLYNAPYEQGEFRRKPELHRVYDDPRYQLYRIHGEGEREI
jgi:hypothetical protein